jgi:hypothetical protein
MPAPIDLTNHVYGRLTVLHEAEPATYPRKWVCQCSCGTVKTILGSSLRSGLTQSCGCLNKERVSATSTAHGKYGTRLYNIWHNMRQRCGNPNKTSFDYYGGNDITVCDEWSEFSNFDSWAVATGYDDTKTLDRIDGTQGYSPDNCRWTTHTIQSRNQKRRRTNTSGYSGVSFIPHLNKYQAYLTVAYKKVNLGYFPTAEEASEARRIYIESNNLDGFPTQ